MNEKTMHLMQIKWVNGRWVRQDGSETPAGGTLVLGGASGSGVGGGGGSENCGTQTLNILMQLQLQQTIMLKKMDEHFDATNARIDKLEANLMAADNYLHGRLNTMKVQLNEIQQAVVLDD